MAALHFSADTCLAMVRSEHQAFYRRAFLGEVIGEPRAAPNFTQKVSLMASDFRATGERVMRRFPVLRSEASEREALFSRAEGFVQAAE